MLWGIKMAGKNRKAPNKRAKKKIKK